MTKPLVLDYLRTHSFAELFAEHGVKARLSTDGSKASLNYDQIAIKNGDLLAEQCRGLIVRVNPDGTHGLLAWPMSRFYNEGDHHASEVNWQDPELKIYEKLDGTMCVLYFDPLKSDWFIATRSVPEADLPLSGGVMTSENITFSQLFWRALDATLNAQNLVPDASGLLPDATSVEMWKKKLCRQITYVFELTSPLNRVVVKYDVERVTLIALRDLNTGRECHDVEWYGRELGVPTPKTWKLGNASAVHAFVSSCNPAELEGAVACDSSGRRVKVKSKAWVLASRSKDSVMTSRRGALESVLDGSIDDVIPLVAWEVGCELVKLRAKTREYFKGVDERFKQYMDESSGSRKTFAGFVMTNDEFAAVFFKMFTGEFKSSVDFIDSLQKAGKLNDSILDQLLSKIDKVKVD